MAPSISAISFRNLCKLKITSYNYRFINSLNTRNKNEFTEKPEYPPIHYAGRKPDGAYKIRVFEEDLRNLPTVEEKLYKMCHYHKCYMMSLFHKCSNSLPMIQYCTQTHLVPHLPEIYDSFETDSLLSKLKPHFVNAIIAEFNQIKRDIESTQISDKDLNCMVGQGIIRQFSRILFSGLSQDYSHLWDAQVDTSARMEAFWRCEFKGKRFLGIRPHEGNRILKKLKNNPPNTNLTLQFAETPFLQIRSPKPLNEFVTMDDDLCTKSEVPVQNFHLNSYGYVHNMRYPTLVAGVWKHDPCKFGLVSFYTREKMLKYKQLYGEDDCRETLIAAGILSSFSWLLSLASLQGFTPYNDVTYPTTTQTVFTDGQLWSFFTYQLNTTKPSEGNPLRNICWHSDEMKLFDEVTNNEVKGLNEDVLKILIKFFCNTPQSRQINYSPYLGEDVMTDQERDRLFYFWPRCYSNRPVQPLEKPLYQYIYRENQERIPRKK